MAEFDLHPVDLEPERAYSPASLSKAYLAAMGITPLLTATRTSRGRSLAMPWRPSSAVGPSAGSAGSRPGRLVDFTSMYPTVDALLDLHRLQLARDRDRPECTEAGRSSCWSPSTLDDCFDPGSGPSWSASPWSHPDG